MLYLNSDLFFAQGDNRKCYLHPDDNNLCIKILHNKIHLKVNQRESAYYKFLIKKNISWDNIAQFYGDIETNFGNGIIFEFIRDYDGKVSKTLDHYFIQNNALSIKIAHLVEELKFKLYEDGVVFRDFIAKNIVVKNTALNTYKLVMIDGIGHNDFIPLVTLSKNFARKKIIRQWNKKRSKWFDHYKNIKHIITDF